MNHYTSVIVFANVITLLGAGAIAFLASRAFRRTQTIALKTAAIGFGFLIIGAAVGNVLYLMSDDLVAGLVTQNIMTASGVLLLVYSLYSNPVAPQLPNTAR